MSIQVIRNMEGGETRSRKIDSRTGNINWVLSEKEIGYLVTGASGRDAARMAVLAEAPESEDALPLKSIRFEGFSGDETMEFSVVYGALETASAGSSGSDDDEGEPTLSFDSSGGTKHLQYAISQKRVHGTKEAKNAIGWNGKGGQECEIAGVDIPIGQMRETYTRIMKMSALTTSFRRKVNACVGKVNANKFKGWEPGEVMFLGMSFSGSVKSSEKITVSFNFQIQPNESKAKVNDIDIGKVQGFEYIWCIPKPVKGKDSLPEMGIDSIYVATVAQLTDFKIFGL